mgnify:FL=1
MENRIEKAESWQYSWGVATVQLIRGETDSPCRLWDGEPTDWWNLPKHPAYAGMAEKIYERMKRNEQRCWESHNKA